MFNRKPQIITYKIETTKIQMPKEDECVIFQFPKDTPREVLEQFDRTIVEFQNQQRNFIVTTQELTFVKTTKGNLERYHDEDDKSRGHSEPAQ
jgi:hypothetical protein